MTSPIDPRLAEGAQNAVVTCLGVQPGERCTLIAEKGLDALAGAFRAALEQAAGQSVHTFLVDGASCEDPARVSEIEARLRDSDVSLLVCSVNGVPTEFRRMVINTPGPRRHAHLPGVTEAMMGQSMRADYEEVAGLGSKLLAELEGGGALRVTTPAGTDLEVQLGTRHRWHNETGLLREPGWMNLPAGELLTTPESVDGLVVPDGGAWDVDGQMLPGSVRMKITIEGGRVTSVDGPAGDVESLLATLDGHENGRRVGQCAFGTNVGVLTPVGSLLQDLKLPGFHLTLGHTAPELTGADWGSPIECPLLLRRADVTLDGKALLQGGRYVARLRG